MQIGNLQNFCSLIVQRRTQLIEAGILVGKINDHLIPQESGLSFVQCSKVDPVGRQSSIIPPEPGIIGVLNGFPNQNPCLLQSGTPQLLDYPIGGHVAIGSEGFGLYVQFIHQPFAIRRIKSTTTALSSNT